ncbi:MAG TPA: hypothetical protein VE441_08525 [Mycobacterium sp.]|jgi:hypothetical protein|nr:hypothetical protein [Mycobacterium sp.]
MCAFDGGEQAGGKHRESAPVEVAGNVGRGLIALAIRQSATRAAL